MKPRLDHVGIAVADVEAARRFYQDVLGLDLGECEDVGAQGVRVQFVLAGGTALELLEATGADSPVGRFLDRRGPGLHHLTFEVEDLAGKLQDLRARGVRLIDEAPRPGAEGALVAFIHPSAAHGVLVELKQRTGGSTRDAADRHRGSERP